MVAPQRSAELADHTPAAPLVEVHALTHQRGAPAVGAVVAVGRQHAHAAAQQDPLELLEKVKHRVVSMHASDRFLKSGTIEDLRREEDSLGYASRLSHGVIGKGMNDYDKIFSILNSVGFHSWISIEDGMNGMDDLRESVRFLREKIDRHFKD